MCVSQAFKEEYLRTVSKLYSKALLVVALSGLQFATHCQCFSNVETTSPSLRCFYGAVVSTLDFESNNPGSNPGRNIFIFFSHPLL
jgi:hypothetical protein